jgi:hypothetical protein
VVESISAVFGRAFARIFFLTMAALTQTWQYRFALFILKPWIAVLATFVYVSFESRGHAVGATLTPWSRKAWLNQVNWSKPFD